MWIGKEIWNNFDTLMLNSGWNGMRKFVVVEAVLDLKMEEWVIWIR